MTIRQSKMENLRRSLTASIPTKQLVLVLIGSWVWLWISSDNPPIFWYLGNTLVAVAFLWFRYGGLIQDRLTNRDTTVRESLRKNKRDFLVLIGVMTVLPVAFTIRIAPWRGIVLLLALFVLATLYVALTPGDLIPEGWLSKRWSRRKKRAAHR